MVSTLEPSAEKIIEWFIKHIDEIFAKHPELKKKLYEKLKEEIEEKMVTRAEIKEILVVIKDLQQQVKDLREDFNKLSSDVRDLQQQVKDLREDFNKLSSDVRDLQQQVKDLREDFNRIATRLELRLEALGARWGILSESAFRNAVKFLVERFFGGRVDKWEYYDDQGYVYGVPSVVDVDVLIRDSEHILIEIRSRIDRPDVVIFKRIADLYEKVVGVHPKLVMVSPYVTSSAMNLASKLDIEIIKGIPEPS